MDTVYVVDADEAIRDSLTTLLESLGVPVKAYADSETFLQAVRDVSSGFVLVEAEMPGLNGLGLLHELRREGSTILVVLITSNASDHFIERARRAGVSAVLRKPFVDDDAWMTLGGDRRHSGH